MGAAAMLLVVPVRGDDRARVRVGNESHAVDQRLVPYEAAFKPDAEIRMVSLSSS
jgi:hypothetical protein